jgi:hypothetical protein
VRALDNSLTAAQQRGSNFYFGNRPADGINIPFVSQLNDGTNFNCNGCHMVDASRGFFGTGGRSSFEGITQIVKIPHLRNLYTKVGMFGVPKVDFFQTDVGTTFQGDQIRGFGFVHDGVVSTVFNFLTAVVFAPQFTSGFPLINPNGTRRDVEQFILAFPTDLAPIVGQQVTLTSANATAVGPRVDLFIQRAKAQFISKAVGGVVKECDLVAQVALGGSIKGFFFDPGANNFISGDGTRVSDSALRALAATPGQEVTYTCAPPGSGVRILASN